MKRKKISVINFMAIGLLAVLLLLTTLNIWNYHTYLIHQQEEEFLRLARAIKFGTEEFLEGEKQAVQGLGDRFSENHTNLFAKPSEIAEELSPVTAEFLQFLEERQDTRNQVTFMDGEGAVLLGVNAPSAQVLFQGSQYPSPEELSSAPEGSVQIGKAYRASEHAYLLPIINCLRSGKVYLIVWINMDEISSFLNRTMADEDRSYVALKTQEGYIISHKNPSQIGLHMVEGRKENYPDLDLSDYEQIMEMQMTGEEATAVYESYWFDREPIVRAKKVASFTPIFLDHEFWVLTLNLDYETYIAPLRQFMFISIGLISAIFLGVAGGFLKLREVSAREREALRENAYLSELQKAQKQLYQEREQKIRAMKAAQLGSMTIKIAHEFKNFLIPIIGCAEFIQNDPSAGDMVKEDAESILEYAEKANELTRQLSRLGRNETAQVPVSEIDLLNELDQFLGGVRRALPEEVALYQETEAGLGIMKGNRTQLQEVFWNLAKNAFDAMSKTGGTLSVTAKLISREELPDQAAASLSDNYCRLVFEDTGCGMDEETQSKIFLTYFTTKPVGEGSGLGLSVVYDVITTMGGDVLVDSHEGEGTRFTLYLPVEVPNLE